MGSNAISTLSVALVSFEHLAGRCLLDQGVGGRAVAACPELGYEILGCRSATHLQERRRSTVAVEGFSEIDEVTRVSTGIEREHRVRSARDTIRPPVAPAADRLDKQRSPGVGHKFIEHRCSLHPVIVDPNNHPVVGAW